MWPWHCEATSLTTAHCAVLADEIYVTLDPHRVFRGAAVAPNTPPRSLPCLLCSHFLTLFHEYRWGCHGAGSSARQTGSEWISEQGLSVLKTNLLASSDVFCSLVCQILQTQAKSAVSDISRPAAVKVSDLRPPPSARHAEVLRETDDVTSRPVELNPLCVSAQHFPPAVVHRLLS